MTKGTVVLLTWPVTMTAGSAWWVYTFSRLGVNGLRVGHLSSIKEHAGRVYLDAHAREVARLDVEFQAGLDAPRRRAIVRDLTEGLRAEVGLTFDLGEWAGSGALESMIIDKNTGKARRWSDRRPDGPGAG